MNNQLQGFSSVITLLLVTVLVIVVAGAYVLQKGGDTDSPLNTVLEKAIPVSKQPQDIFCPRITRDLAQGSKDEKINGPDYAKGEVSYLQMFLRQRYSIEDEGFVDGIYGPNTATYVKRFQSESQLTADGIVGTETRARILKLCADPLPSVKTTQVLTSAATSQTITLHADEAYAEPGDPVEGHFRIEYVSSTPATIRVTGRTLGGGEVDVMTFSGNEEVLSNHWPVGIEIKLNKVNPDNSLELTIRWVSTD